MGVTVTSLCFYIGYRREPTVNQCEAKVEKHFDIYPNAHIGEKVVLSVTSTRQKLRDISYFPLEDPKNGSCLFTS